jgi:HAMP domain-containing protein
MSLRRRIMLLVTIGLVVATVPLGVMGIGMLRAATDRILAERLAMARATSQHLSERLSQGWSQLDRLGNRIAPLWRAGDLGGVRAVFADVAPQMALFSGGIFLMDSAGRLVVQAPLQTAFPSDLLAGLPSVKKTMTAGRPSVSDLIQAPARVYMVIFTVPVTGGSDVSTGVVGGVLNLSNPTLRAFINGLAVGTSGHAAIVNEHGTVLASTDPTEQFVRGEHPEFFARGIAGGRAIVGPAEEVHEDGSDRAEVHIMAFAPLSTVPWGLGIGQNEEETFGPVRRLRDRIILFGMVVLATALLFAWLDTGAVAAPLRLLKESAERIAGGDLGRRIEVHRVDEIGALAESFDVMRVRLLGSLVEI